MTPDESMLIKQWDSVVCICKYIYIYIYIYIHICVYIAHRVYLFACEYIPLPSLCPPQVVLP